MSAIPTTAVSSPPAFGGASPGWAVDLSDVAKTYKGRIQALRGVSMKVAMGEIFGLLGPNGAGKSTLVKILMTVISPSRAHGTVLGQPVGHKGTLARVGYLPEHHRFPDYLSGGQVLEFYAGLCGVGRADRKKRRGELLELVGMTRWGDTRVKSYSKGMRQRIGIAQALMNDPDLVVLDEPTDGVDPVGRRDIRNILLEVKRRGKAVFLNSHLLSELEMVCDRVAILVQGVVAFEITGKNGQVGVVALGMGVSTIVTAPFGGVIADRVSKRKLLLIGQGLTAVNFAGVGVLIVLDMITIPLLVFSTFVMGLVFSFIAPARQAWIGVLLKGPRLGNGIALQQVAMTATRILGPGMAAALIAISVVGSGGAYLFMGLLLAIVVATLAKMPPSPAPPRDAKSTALSGLSDGARHVKGRPRLALLTMSFIATVVFGFSYQVILPGYLHNVHGRETSDMGLLLVVSGVAGLVATMAVANRAASAAAWPLLLIGAAVLGLGLIGLGMAPTFGLSLALMLVIGAGASVFQLLNSALVMQESDPAYYGRVMSLTMMAWGFNSLAGLPFGLLADGIGEQGTLAVMGAGVLVITALTAVLRGFARRSEPDPIAIANPASDRFAT